MVIVERRRRVQSELAAPEVQCLNEVGVRQKNSERTAASRRREIGREFAVMPGNGPKHKFDRVRMRQ